MKSAWWDKIHSGFDAAGKFKYLTNGALSEYLDFFELGNWDYKPILEMGIGTGRAVKELSSLGKEIHAYDISSIALNRVSSCAITYEKTDEIPINHFSLIISRLVVQHLLDSDLEDYLSLGIKALNKGGIFVIQFANSDNMQYSPDANTGGMVRTPIEMEEFIRQAGGKIIKSVKPKIFKKGRIGTGYSEVVWHGIHVNKL